MEKNPTSAKATAGSKTGKYLKYAIGEIVLVMIGILLALQVNNWNEIRKQRIEEIGLLKALKTDIEIKNKQLQEVYDYNKKTHETTIRFIMSQLNHKEETFDIKDVLKFGDYVPVSTHINSLEVALEGNTVTIFRSDSLVNMLRKLKANLVIVEIDEAYLDELWTSNLVPYLQESGLSIHRFALIHKGIEPGPEVLNGIDLHDFANRTSDVASIEFEWLKSQKLVLEDMSNLMKMVRVELEK